LKSVMTARRRLPRWSDERAVARLVDEEIEQAELEEERLFYTHYAPQLPGVPESQINVGIERDAVAAALRGNIAELASLLDPEHPYNKLRKIPIRSCLSPATWQLIVQFLTGERSRRSGQLKGERGRPPMSAEERRTTSPVHDAADEVSAIRHILGRLYSEQDHGQINDRAISIAAQRRGIATRTLAKYLSRPKKDRRRLAP
jgi:hypothetical protein